jgi:uncharacterized protein YndB with AHSA1/START domain
VLLGSDMLKKLAIALVVVIVAVLGIAATRPDSFRVERRVTIKAPPEAIFAIIQDFRGWSRWSPYDQLDPAMKRTYSGAPSGKGAVYEWQGNDKVGTGRMEITDATAPTKVVIALDFLKPFEGHDVAEFTMVPSGDATTVTWAIHGPSPLMSKVMGLLFDMDKMIGSDFEVGLGNLKLVLEK